MNEHPDIETWRDLWRTIRADPSKTRRAVAIVAVLAAGASFVVLRLLWRLGVL